MFSVYARLNGDTRFEAGTYDLRKRMGVRAAVKALKAGPRIDYAKLTIPPGLWLKEIAQRVGKMPGQRARRRSCECGAEQRGAIRFEPEGVNNLEGLLWPDTYKISAEEDEIQVLKTMADTFDKKAPRHRPCDANVHGHGPYQIVTIASMIEAEAKTPGDRPLIASVIYNRLAQKHAAPDRRDARSTRVGDPRNRSSPTPTRRSTRRTTRTPTPGCRRRRSRR